MIDTLFHPLEGPQIVKAHLNVEGLRTLLKRLLYMLVTSTVIYVVLYGITPSRSGVYSVYQLLSIGYQACFILITPFILFYILYFFINIPSLKEREQRRQMAASGDQRFLSIDQPIPDVPTTLALPFTIKLYPDWSIMLTSLAIMLPSMGILSLAWSHFRPDPVFDVLLFIVGGMCVFCFCLFLLWKFYLQKSTQLLVSEDGLTFLRSRSTVHHLSWKDVRLFAIDAHSVFLNEKHPIAFFEIASIQEVIHWTWKLSGNSLVRSSASFKEYDRQMHVLLSLITTRTGLPLYDLQKQ